MNEVTLPGKYYQRDDVTTVKLMWVPTINPSSFIRLLRKHMLYSSEDEESSHLLDQRIRGTRSDECRDQLDSLCRSTYEQRDLRKYGYQQPDQSLMR
jgi:hypothetical protein